MNGELHGDQPESTDTGVPKRAVRENRSMRARPPSQHLSVAGECVTKQKSINTTSKKKILFKYFCYLFMNEKKVLILPESFNTI